MVGEIARVQLAQDYGDLSKLAIWDIAGGDGELVSHLTRLRDEWREAGISEEAIAEAIRRGDAANE